MTSKLVIIRGNSGCGKSTVAKKLRDKLGDNTMLIPQDVVRKLILGVKDRELNPAVQLIHDVALYGKSIGYNVVLEGILYNKIYGQMLNELVRSFDGNAYVYYFDIAFEETLRRHGTLPPEIGFGEAEMRKWWHEKDFLGIKNEIIIDESLSEDETVDTIYEHIVSN
jgi:energy-coupling factor transporter ATP-binding protein EcfA2